jgi:hypothetical protein
LEDVVGRFDVLDFAENQFVSSHGIGRPMQADDVATMAKMAARRPSVAPSLATEGATKRYGVEANHAYAVLGFRNGIRLRNPWGDPGGTITIPVSGLRTAFHGIWQAT